MHTGLKSKQWATPTQARLLCNCNVLTVSFANTSYPVPAMRLLYLLLPALLCLPQPALALMAGAAPDSPSARIDMQDDSVFGGVGSLSIKDHTYTGVLISPRHVLTAAHVAGSNTPREITFHLGKRGEITHSIQASEIHIYPGYTGFAAGKPGEGDLAVITLDKAIDATTPVYPISRRSLQPGTRLLMASFGASGHGNQGASIPASANQRRVGANVADIVRPARDGTRAQALYYFDFDGPDERSNRFGGLTLGNGIETSLANGDSGSPAFVVDGEGHLVLVGLNSFRFGQDSTFGNGGGGQVLASYADWIDSALLDSTPLPPAPTPLDGVPLSFVIVALGLFSGLPLLRKRARVRS